MLKSANDTFKPRQMTLNGSDLYFKKVGEQNHEFMHFLPGCFVEEVEALAESNLFALKLNLSLTKARVLFFDCVIAK